MTLSVINIEHISQTHIYNDLRDLERKVSFTILYLLNNLRVADESERRKQAVQLVRII